MFDDLERQIESIQNYTDIYKLALKIALGFWRDYRRANGIE